MTEERTCRCKGQFAMHEPALHADRDGSERELLRYLAAEYEASADDMAEWAETSIGLAAHVTESMQAASDADTMRSFEVEAWRNTSDGWQRRAEKAEAALARVDALADEWGRVGGFLAASQMQRLREALREPDPEAAS